MEHFDKNFEHISRDIECLTEKLNDKLEKLAVFGSFNEKEFEKINDVDILMFYKDISYDELLKQVNNLGLSQPVTMQYMNYSTGAPSRNERSKHDFHIIAMPIEHPNEDFFKLNKSEIRDLLKR